jgi:hypothetical protein
MATATGKAIVSAQVDASVRATLEREAEAADRTLSAEIRRVLVEHVHRLENGKASA